MTGANNVASESSKAEESSGDALNGRLHYRFYGNSFTSAGAEKLYKQTMREAKERDHRVVGKKLEMLLFDGNSPGNVFFLDRGLFTYSRLVDYLKSHYLQEYEEIASPLLFKSNLWKISGHYDHYRSNMFQVNTREKDEVGVKTSFSIGNVLKANELSLSLHRLRT